MRIRIRAAALIATVAAISPALSGQWPPYPTANAPRTAGGQVNLAAPTPRTADGKPDLSGIWEVVRAGTGQVVVGADVPALSRTSPFFNIGTGLEGGLPLRPWAAELRARRVADHSKDNPDAHCLPLGLSQLHNHPQPRKIIQTPSLIVILYEANGGVRQIFMDGRPLPRNDPQPWWYGYSVGKWDGDTLEGESIGLKAGGWLDVHGALLPGGATITRQLRHVTVRQLLRRFLV